MALVREMLVRGGSATVAGTRSSRRVAVARMLYLLDLLYLLVGEMLVRTGLSMVAAGRSRGRSVAVWPGGKRVCGLFAGWC